MAMGRSKIDRRGATARAIALAGATAAVFAALATGGSAAPDVSTADSITIGFTAPQPTFAQFYATRINGSWAAQDLDVKFRYVENAALAALVSGQVDLVLQGVPFPVIAANTGAPSMKIVYNFSGSGNAAYVAARPSVRTLSDCTRMASTAPGTAVYGWATFMKEKLNLKYDIVPIASAASAAAVLVSGQVDCSIGVYNFLGPIVSRGDAHWIVNPEVKAQIPQGIRLDLFSSGGLVGLDSWLTTHRAQVQRLIKGLNRSIRVIRSDPETIARLVIRDADLAALQLETVIDQVKHLKPFWSPFDGFFPPNNWPATQAWLRSSGLSFVNGADAKWGYRNFVDMSYYNAALKGTRTVKIDKAHRTLRTIAAKVFGDRTLWATLYDSNKKVFQSRRVSKAKAAGFALPVGTVLRY
jgi:ABC-type nitrate/sulfonate/bicarbonate transport system substrate-binding protein